MTEQSWQELRSNVRAWCADHVPPNWRREQSEAGPEQFVAFQQQWYAALQEAGWAVPHWPAEHGGGYPLEQQAVIFEELARADAPRLVLHFVSIHHAAATLLHAGTARQRERHLPAIRAGEVWCQGFSEPGAGSDLAALTTRAAKVNGGYVVNGQKTWASLAMYAQWCLLLARTDPKASPRRGISYFLMDMSTAGIDVRPIRQATGDEHFAEVFLTDVFIPEDCLVGEENRGWQAASATLAAERGETILELAERLAVGFEWLVESADVSDPVERDELARLWCDVQALRQLCRAEPAGLDDAGMVHASVVKVFYSELLQRLTRFAVTVSGLAGQRKARRPMSSGWESGVWLLDFLGSWEWTIPGGANEIQRTIIAERGLGLPREPAVP